MVPDRNESRATACLTGILHRKKMMVGGMPVLPVFGTLTCVVYIASFLCNIAEYSLRLSHCHILVLYKTSDTELQCQGCTHTHTHTHTHKHTHTGQKFAFLHFSTLMRTYRQNHKRINGNRQMDEASH